MVTTGLEIPGYRIIRNIGVARGIIVRSRSIFGTIGAGLQTIVGGNISLFTKLCEKAHAKIPSALCSHMRTRWEAMRSFAPAMMQQILWGGRHRSTFIRHRSSCRKNINVALWRSKKARLVGLLCGILIERTKKGLLGSRFEYDPVPTSLARVMHKKYIRLIIEVFILCIGRNANTEPLRVCDSDDRRHASYFHSTWAIIDESFDFIKRKRCLPHIGEVILFCQGENI